MPAVRAWRGAGGTGGGLGGQGREGVGEREGEEGGRGRGGGEIDGRCVCDNVTVERNDSGQNQWAVRRSIRLCYRDTTLL